jgi:peptide/nickel transport system ATP-binding protein
VSPLLEVKDVHVTFPVAGWLKALVTGSPRAIEAVAGVSFDIAAGETFALVGESGSGKTTLARAINGLLRPASGRIRFEDRELAGLPESAMAVVRRHISMVFQDPVGSLSPRLTVRAILAEPFHVHGLAGPDLDQRIARLLSLVGLPPEFAERYPHQLSGGQARRVGVARAIALEPKLVIADEPTAGLDVSVQGEVLNLLNDLQARLGIAILIITHNLNVVRHVADRMAIMYLGRIVEEGATEAIFEAPRHPYTLALLSANPEPDPDAVIQRIELVGEVPSLLNRPRGCEFHTRCPWVEDLCRKEAPAMTDMGGGRRYTCHFPREEALAPD